ncbi:DEKNAAC102941 [Brettanomyces naardenensis]|uniref:DEKNAAC102941 n=1 Tax=Brettanomyces naardenensis TaxID=13370 RepID=A0A448YLZ0_BRENA|nr:DEKNAAC102941 [Brettanomyces naardenensis]
MDFFYRQLFKTPVYPTGSYSSKTIVVTGSNTGLGKEASRHFARLGAKKLILAVRNLDKGNAAKKDIEETTNCGSDVIEVWKLDMSSYDSVKAFAKRVNEDLDRLDIFLANAGVVKKDFEIVEQDEATITINDVSTFLLCRLVLPKLEETAKKYKVHPNLTITSSETHTWTTFPAKTAPEGEIFNTISDSEFAKAHWNDQYPISKLIEVFRVRSIGEKYPDLGVTVNAVNPGFCESELSREMDNFVIRLGKFLLARTSEVGSRNLVYAASLGPEGHGKYISDTSIVEPSDFVKSEEGKILQERLWDELNAKLDKILSK